MVSKGVMAINADASIVSGSSIPTQVLMATYFAISTINSLAHGYIKQQHHPQIIQEPPFVQFSVALGSTLPSHSAHYHR